MGFFSDLKEDLSQAVSELMPQDQQTRAGTEQKTTRAPETATSVSEISLEEMLNNIDDAIDEALALNNMPGPEQPAGGRLSPQPPSAGQPETVWTDTVSEPEPPAESAEDAAEMIAAELGAAQEEYAGAAQEEPAAVTEEMEVAELEAVAAEYGQPEEAGLVEYEQSVTGAAEEAAGPVTEAEEAYVRPTADIVGTGSTDTTQEQEMEKMVSQMSGENTAELQEQNGGIQIEESKGAEETMEMSSRVVLDETSVITAGMVITGDLNTEGSIDVAGTINGNVSAYGKLNITGHVNGNSRAAEIYAENAKINGEIISEGSVKIESSTVIIGNITATSAAIAGAVKGDIDVKGPVILDASAIVMGNIKSKSVQINNGAVIEGMCSQCYADINPVAFFDDYKPDAKSKSK